MAEYKLNAKTRTQFKKSDTKKLRRDGFIPGSYYFHKQSPVPFTVDKKELRLALAAESRLYDLKIENKSHKAIIKEVQRNPVTDEIIHIDFMGVNLKEVINYTVPVVIIGTADGVLNQGGVLDQHLYELDVRCKVADIPSKVDVDVTELNVSDAVFVRDIKIENVEILTADNINVVSVVLPTQIVEPEEEVEGEEGLEGEEGEEGAEKSPESEA